MNISRVNFTTPETSKNSTIQSTGLLETLELWEIYVYSISFMVGFPTHSYVIWLIITGGRSKVVSEFFILSLSVCEIGICLYCLFYIVNFFIASITILPLFLLGLVFAARPLFQCLMCVERYLAVVCPVTFLKYKPLRNRVICSTLIWIITLGSCLCSMLSSISNIPYVYTWYFSMQFLILFSIQLFCLAAVIRALKQSGPGERMRGRNPLKRRAFHLILITSVSMFIMHVSYIIAGFLSILNHKIQALWVIFLVCYVLTGLVQPVLYLHRSGKLSCLCFP